MTRLDLRRSRRRREFDGLARTCYGAGSVSSSSRTWIGSFSFWTAISRRCDHVAAIFHSQRLLNVVQSVLRPPSRRLGGLLATVRHTHTHTHRQTDRQSAEQSLRDLVVIIVIVIYICSRTHMFPLGNIWPRTSWDALPAKRIAETGESVAPLRR